MRATTPDGPAPTLGARLGAWCDAARRVLHAVLGVPDYERYVAHLRARDPGCAIPDRATFERERLAARYSRPGSRCC